MKKSVKKCKVSSRAALKRKNQATLKSNDMENTPSTPEASVPVQLSEPSVYHESSESSEPTEYSEPTGYSEPSPAQLIDRITHDTPDADIEGVEAMPANSLFIGKGVNDWMREAAMVPEPRSLWRRLWIEGEACCLFADTNLGKSILAVQIADEITRETGRKVLYFDFELSAKQFQVRYSVKQPDGKLVIHGFSNAFKRFEVNPSFCDYDTDPVELYLSTIEREVVRHDAKIVIIDNLTWICNASESGDAAGQFMQRLVEIKKRNGLSILVIAHTPKRIINTKLTQNSLAGSKRLANFFDAMMAVGASVNEQPSGRYIKQLKARSTEIFHGENSVLACHIVREGAMLKFDGWSTANEDVLLTPEGSDKVAKHDEIARMLQAGIAIRDISSSLRVSNQTIYKVKQSLKAA